LSASEKRAPNRPPEKRVVREDSRKKKGFDAQQWSREKKGRGAARELGKKERKKQELNGGGWGGEKERRS